MGISWTGMSLQSDFAYSDPDNGSLHYFGFNPDAYGEISRHFDKVIKRYANQSGQVGLRWADAYDDIISREYWNELIKRFDD
jgi:predicted GIY-YIG superfamily endonuclease